MAEVKEIKFKYDKSRHFRVIHADGFWGGISPNGYIHMSPYNERYPLPDITSLSVSDNQIVKPEAKVSGSSEIFREVEADIIMDVNAAMALHVWLGAKIQEFLQQHLGMSPEEATLAMREANANDNTST